MPGPRRHADLHAFLVLPENKLAVAALQGFLKPAPRRTPSQHLLTLIGPPGTGKSHLLRQTLKASASSTGWKVLQLTASEFAARFAEAVESRSERQFQLRHRKNIDLLIIEDIAVLGGRPETQTQLQATLDDILAHAGRCLLTSPCPPGEIPGLSRKLVNRIHGGITVSLDLPGESSKELLSHHLTDALQLTLTDEGARALARAVKTPAELVGLLKQIRQSLRGSRNPVIDEELVSRFVIQQPVTQKASLEQIANLVSREFQIPLDELKSASRSRQVLIPRQVAMYLAREIAHKNYGEIGEYFGQRNHNTALYACRRIESLLPQETGLAQTIHRLSTAAETHPRKKTMSTKR